MTIFYTADTHFYHNNIVALEGRPFESTQAMNTYLINKWNAQVSPNDTVRHIGDFALTSFRKTVELLEQLNGKKVIIGGNHDDIKIWERILKERPDLIEAFIPVGFREKWGKEEIWFSHFPMEIGLREGKWNVHGHIHGVESTYLNRINVGVDSRLFKHLPFGTLLTQEDIISAMVYRRKQIAYYTHK